jgi:hypothetical protein
MHDYPVGVRADSTSEAHMRITIRPAMEPFRAIDITDRLIAAIADELWRACGGNAQLNWIEAEAHLAAIMGEARQVVSEVGVPESGLECERLALARHALAAELCESRRWAACRETIASELRDRSETERKSLVA